MRYYWNFYWPLALMGIGLVLSMQFQNATIARYPQAVNELATLALAFGVFGFFNAGLQFVSQLANVFARSPHALRQTQRFVWLVGITLTLPIGLMATSVTGHTLLQTIFAIDAELATRVSAYLMLMTPLILLNCHRHHLTGLLIQARLTRWVTVYNFTYLGVVTATLLTGFWLELTPMYVVVGAEMLGVLALLSCLVYARYNLYCLPAEPSHNEVTLLELTRFFIPVSTTGFMFALSRPILFAFAARSPNALLTIASLRVAFDFTMIFQQAANQFRHFFISFGFDDLTGKRAFMRYVALGLTAFMALISMTPIADWVWGSLIGLPADLLQLAIESMWVLCLTPATIIYRNYFHSRLMHMRRTAGMAYGSGIRVLAIFVAAALLQTTGYLNHLTASACLILGFVVEAFVSQWMHARVTAELQND
jgi:hypothetical protein